MAETSYRCRDYGGQIDLDSHWVEQSIQSEIQRGEKLRQQKLLERAKDGVASKFIKPPSLARSPYPAKRRDHGFDAVRKRAKSNSPSHFDHCASSRSERGSCGSSVRRGRPVCSMRISQLAEPTKRQCIETWRHKANVLPAIMVQRLKQQVMDQKPIVQVSDAITVFKHDKTAAKKRPQRKINKEAMKQRELEDNENLSVVFGNKLAQRLTTPTNVTLIPRLRNISSVVTSEIRCVMKDRRRWMDEATHQRMIREISDKVTIWIADILEDTAEKLLEEDLRVKKMNERIPATVDGEVITLINTMVDKETELEEQEGPALDVLEEVVDSVLDICVPSNTEFMEDDSDNDNLSADYLSVSSGHSIDTDILEVVDDDSIKKHLMNQLLDIIGTIKSNENLNIDASTEGHPNIEEKQSISYLPIPNVNDQIEIDLSPTSDSFQSLASQNVDKDLAESLAPDNNVNPDEEQSSNVSVTLDILREDDSIKKVTFSHDNIGSLIRDKEQLVPINSSKETHLQNENDTTRVTSETSLSTLRGVYDSWPSDLPINIVKPSASVSKSITSLGRILESDERSLLSPEVEVTSEQLTPRLPEKIELLDNSDTPHDDAKYENDTVNGIVVELIDSGDKINNDFFKNPDANEYNEERDKNSIVEYRNQSTLVVGEIQKEKQDINEVKNINQKEDNTEHQAKEFQVTPDNKFKSIKDISEIEPIVSRRLDRPEPFVGDQELNAVPESIFPRNSEIINNGQSISKETGKSMNDICINHNSSKQSLVSIALFELQKRGGKIQDFVTVREQSRYISKMRVQCECPKSDKKTQNELVNSEINETHSRTTTTVVPKKFDYRVQAKTAPAWITRGQGEPAENLPKNFMCPRKDDNLERTKSVREREREIRKWCNDLDRILMNLSKWRTWLEYITKYITTLKQRADYTNLSKTNSSKIVAVDRLKPPKTIDKDVKWTKLNQRANGGLKLYRNDETIKFKISPAAMAVKHYKSCVCTKQTKRVKL